MGTPNEANLIQDMLSLDLGGMYAPLVATPPFQTVMWLTLCLSPPRFFWFSLLLRKCPSRLSGTKPLLCIYRHDNGTQFPILTYSLESPASIDSKKMSATKHGRNHAGTIYASDFAQPGPSGTRGPTLTCPPFDYHRACWFSSGRVCSGTVVGPNSKLVIWPHMKGAMRKQPVMQLTRRDAH
ncbi:hypothetical protein BDR04DRAFT_1158653 [Suillus decipiens]|nr:hypothetical protein BDR04DRAFT_1158653 [Suillus decipiens]